MVGKDVINKYKVIQVYTDMKGSELKLHESGLQVRGRRMERSKVITYRHISKGQTSRKTTDGEKSKIKSEKEREWG